MLRRRASLALPLLAAPTLASAAEWPSRPVRLLVGFPPGASTDLVARALAERLGRLLPQPVVVENRPGAGGNIAAVAALQAGDGGHTVLIHSTAFSVNPSLYRAAGYALDDFRAVAVLGDTPNALFVHPSVPARTVPELIALARGGRRMEYASSGTGTTPHLGAELLFRRLAGVEVLHVPFGPAQAAAAVAGGQAQIGSTSLPPALALIREGRVRGIATMGSERDPALPDLPTVAEQGFPGFRATTWVALLAPARGAEAAVARLLPAVRAALDAPETRERLAALAMTDPGLAGAAADDFARREAELWAGVVRASGATAD